MRQYHFIIKLLKTFKQKKDILDEMRKYISLVDEIVSDPAWAHEDRHRQLLLHHSKLFHPESGMPFLIDSLICANDQLAAYYDDNKNKIDVRNKIAQCGEYISNSYLRMMTIVGREQFLLNEVFKPTLKEIGERQGDANAWANNLSHFSNLLDLIEADLKFADLLTHNLKAGGYLDFLNKPSDEEIWHNKAIVVENAVKCIENNDLVNARKWISAGRWREWLDMEEYLLLLSLTEAIEQKNASELKKLLENKKLDIIFNKKELSFFKDILQTFDVGIIIKETEDLISQLEQEKTELAKLKSSIKNLDIELGKLKNQAAERIRAEARKVEEAKKAIEEAKSKRREELKRRFAEGLQVLKESINLRKQITAIINSVIASFNKRRSLLKFAGAAAGAALVGGAAMLTREKPKEEAIISPLPKSKVLEIEVTFPTTSISEVNKTIYTEGSYLNAKYMVVIPHSTELNALEAARGTAKGPITYVAGNHDRNLKIKTKDGTFEIDPNNSFCVPGIARCFEFLHGKGIDSLRQETKNYIISVINKFTSEISKRIFDYGSPYNKMILALHQNTQNSFGARSYRDESRFSVYAQEVFINQNEDNDAFAYVNTRGWFEVLKAKGWNVVLQKNDRSLDDGSISYAATWRNLPYVNIEVQVGDAQKQTGMIGLLNSLIEQYPQLAKGMNYAPDQDSIFIWDKFEKEVRDGIIRKENAKAALNNALNRLNEFSLKQYPQLAMAESESFIFPIRNGTLRNIIFGRGDYHPQSPLPAYDFFDGNKHGGHPAYDIFINEKDVKIDANNDCFIDSTGKPAIALSLVNGIVASINTGWSPKSDLRGGNYVWIYNPSLDMLFYYAHLNEIFVSPGQFVARGQEIGAVGKTGRRAASTECHVHLMALKHARSDLVPVDYYDNIVYYEKEGNLKSIAGNFNILFIGSDLMPDRTGIGERGDSLVLVNTDSINKTVRIITVPRDTYVIMPNKGSYDKINHALSYGGWQLQKEAVENFLGIKADKVFFIDVVKLRDMFNLVRQKTGNDVIKDVYSKLGFLNSVDIAWDSMVTAVTNRSLKEAAVGRAKNHARIIEACIKTLREYYSKPDKQAIFEESAIKEVLGIVRHTDLTAQDIRTIIEEWSTKEYKTELFCVPGKPQYLGGVSYWIPEKIGNGNYFASLISYGKSRFG